MKNSSYIVRIDEEAEHDLKRLPKRARDQVSKKIESLAHNPRPDGVKKLKGMEGLYRIRVGDYRVVYTIQDKVLLILIVSIARRKDVYRNVIKFERRQRG